MTSLWKKFKQAKKGLTLVELMVTFALLALLMTCAIQTLVPATNVYMQIRSMGDAQSVSSNLIEKIGSELENATGLVEIAQDGKSVTYQDRTGYGVVMQLGSTTSDQRLHLLYQASSAEDENIDWYFPSNMYMNQVIEELTFEKEEDTKNISVHLKLHNTRTNYNYERTKVVQCFKTAKANIKVATTESP